MGRRGGMTEGRPELEKTVGLEAPVGGGGDHTNYKRVRVLSLSTKTVLCS